MPAFFSVPVATDATLSEHNLAEFVAEALAYFKPMRMHAYYENPKRTDKRYWHVATVIAHEVRQVESPFDDDPDRVELALLLAAISSKESHLIHDIVYCKKAGMGQAYGVFQSESPKAKVCGDGKADPVVTATRLAIEQVATSFFVCRELPVAERLALYANGMEWNTDKAKRRSRARVEPAIRYFLEHPRDWD